jgi:NAD(P)-dependent dehydrogenase (short-subunit alcohol dehydrogenase family)
MTRAAVPEMLKAGGGAIVNISSIAGLVGIPLNAAYSATKGGLDALTRCLAIDYANQGIRCNAVCPGLVDTPMAAPLLNDPTRKAQVLTAYPLGRPGTPDEVANLVLYLASEESAWVTGTIVPIDGGMTAQ